MSFLSTLPFLLMLAAPNADLSKTKSAIRVTAKSVEVDHTGRTATLKGDVNVVWGSVSLTANRIDVSYSKTGAPTNWKASGNVRVTWQTYTITSKNLNIEQNQTVLVFKGPLKFTQGASQLQARQATLDLNTKKLSIKEVEGQMNLDNIIKSP